MCAAVHQVALPPLGVPLQVPRGRAACLIHHLCIRQREHPEFVPRLGVRTVGSPPFVLGEQLERLVWIVNETLPDPLDELCIFRLLTCHTRPALRAPTFGPSDCTWPAPSRARSRSHLGLEPLSGRHGLGFWNLTLRAKGRGARGAPNEHERAHQRRGEKQKHENTKTWTLHYHASSPTLPYDPHTNSLTGVSTPAVP